MGGQNAEYDVNDSGDRASLLNRYIEENAGCSLYDYQQEGVSFILDSFGAEHGCILADEMGLGKTIQAISLLVYEEHLEEPVQKVHQKSLVLCPLSTLENWDREFQRWGCGISHVIYHGHKDERPILRRKLRDPANKCRAIVTTYEMCLTDKDFFAEFRWRNLIVDEAHRLKNHQSQLYLLLQEFDFDRCLLMTGTPIQNNLDELYSLLSFCDGKFSLDNREAFIAKYTKRVANLRPILDRYMIRRTKEQVGLDLPEKSEILLYHSITPLQKKIYKNILSRNYKPLISSEEGKRNRLMNTLIQLRKCVSHPYIFSGVEPEPFEEGEHLVEAAGKLTLLDALLEFLHAKKHRVLLFFQMTRTMDIIQDYLTYRGYSYERLDGSVRREERFAAIDRFGKEDVFCFMLSTRAGGLGINLMDADTVIFYESDLNPQCDIQAAARAHRIGQKRPVRIIRLVARHTVEELIYSRSEAKAKLAMAVMDEDTEELGGKFTWAELLSFGLHDLDKEDDDATGASAGGQPVAKDVNFERLLGKTKKGEWQELKTTATAAKPPSPAAKEDDEIPESVIGLYTFEGHDYTEEAKAADRAAFDALGEAMAVTAAARKDATTASEEVLARRRGAIATRYDIEEVRKAQELAKQKRKVAAKKKAEEGAKRKLAAWSKAGYKSTNLPEPDNDEDKNPGIGDADTLDDDQMGLGDEREDSKLELIFVRGDVTHPSAKKEHKGLRRLIVHCVDNSGVWGGGGVFRALSARSATPQSGYEKAKEMKDLCVGDAHLFELEEEEEDDVNDADDDVDGDGKAPDCVVLIVAQTRRQGQVSSISLKSFEQALRRISYYAKSITPTDTGAGEAGNAASGDPSTSRDDNDWQKHDSGCSIHLPRIGYGTPNFNWYAIERLIRKWLAERSIPTYIYYYKRGGAPATPLVRQPGLNNDRKRRHSSDRGDSTTPRSSDRRESSSPGPSKRHHSGSKEHESDNMDDQQPSTSCVGKVSATDDGDRSVPLLSTSHSALPNLFTGTTIHLHDLTGDHKRSLKRTIIAMDGDVIDELDAANMEAVTHVIVKDDFGPKDIEELSLEVNAPFIRRSWVQECIKANSMIPLDDFVL